MRLEGQVDGVHEKGLKGAFQRDRNDPMQFIITSEIYQHLERIMDAFEDVANEIDDIVVDHS